uniref:Putative secreted peptide n=1 Tax=Anopheles braziliensis TaxID=58242 RepID=A0A2M3ZVN1_9DIPT
MLPWLHQSIFAPFLICYLAPSLFGSTKAQQTEENKDNTQHHSDHNRQQGSNRLKCSRQGGESSADTFTLLDQTTRHRIFGMIYVGEMRVPCTTNTTCV